MAESPSNDPSLECVSKLELHPSISKEATSPSIVTIEGADIVAPNLDPTLAIPGLQDEALPHPPPEYRLYKRRFAGLFGVVRCSLSRERMKAIDLPVSLVYEYPR